MPYGRQDIVDEDVDAVIEVLRSDWLTQGPTIERFEQVVAEYCSASYAVAVNSATSALHIAYLALGVGPGDCVWTVPNTFVATANAALYCGADVDFVDINESSLNIDIDLLRIKLERAEKQGSLPKVVVPVHFSGCPADMKGIRALADRYKFKLVEDASHAIGAEYRGRRVGAGVYSDITVFSFHPVKVITTGEGGMALTEDKALADLMRSLRSHGITRDPLCMQGESEGGWYYEQIGLGYNYRLTDLQAALGVSQMRRLDQFLARRRELADRYDRLLSTLDIRCPIRISHAISAWHLYVVQVPERRRVYELLRNAGVGVNVHYIPVHLQPYYRARGYGDGDYPVTESYYRHALTIPLYPAMTNADQDIVADNLKLALSSISEQLR